MGQTSKLRMVFRQLMTQSTILLRFFFYPQFANNVEMGGLDLGAIFCQTLVQIPESQCSTDLCSPKNTIALQASRMPKNIFSKLKHTFLVGGGQLLRVRKLKTNKQTKPMHFIKRLIS